jgi:signal transduction histidine kinase
VLRDVTRERQAELAKTEFIATISHELRTPLTSIKGYAELMHAGVTGPLSEQQAQFVGKIRSQSQHLTQIINEIIQYSELERGKLVTTRQPFDMRQLVEEALGAVKEQTEAEGFGFSLYVEPGAPMAYADSVRTRHIVDQLLDNALRFTPTPGHITLSIRPIHLQEHRTANTPPPFVSLSISDTGVGIAPDDVERIFERFYRADNPMQVTAGGLGLGLTIAHALAVAQDGRLWAQSPAIERPTPDPNPDLPGATFTLQLPAHVP